MVTETIIYKTHINDSLIDNVINNEDLSKKDLRIIMLLFTKLSGYFISRDISLADKRLNSPNNFVSINVDSIAETLNLKKKDVRKSIDFLIREGVLETGDTSTTKHGYRFTF